MNVIPFRNPHEYTAIERSVDVPCGRFIMSGTLCGNIDLALPVAPSTTLNLSPDEVEDLIRALSEVRQDVIDNSRPFTDPRLYDRDGANANPVQDNP